MRNPGNRVIGRPRGTVLMTADHAGTVITTRSDGIRDHHPIAEDSVVAWAI